MLKLLFEIATVLIIMLGVGVGYEIPLSQLSNRSIQQIELKGESGIIREYDGGYSEHTHDSCSTGIAGFGSGPTSIPSQLKAKNWGYCLPGNDVGSQGILWVDEYPNDLGTFQSAPIWEFERNHMSNLTAIYYADGTIDVAQEFAPIRFDTMTSFTYLLPSLYDLFEENMSKMFSGINKSNKVYLLEDTLCCKDKVDTYVTLSIGEIKLIIMGDVLWFDVGDLYCLTIKKQKKEAKSSIIGHSHYRQRAIIYDLEDMKMIVGDYYKMC